MCLHILACIGLVYVVFFCLCVVVGVLGLLATLLVLSLEPFWSPGPVIDPHPALVSPTRPACLDSLIPSITLLIAEHILLATLLATAWRHLVRAQHTTVIIQEPARGYGTLEA